MTDGTGDVQPSLHTAGEGFCILVSLLQESHIFQRLIDPLFKLRALDAVKGCEELHILPGLQIAVDRKLLRNVPELSQQVLSIFIEILTHELHIAEGRPHDPADHVHGRALSGAVRAEKSEDLSLLDFQIQVVHHHMLVIFLCQIDCF